MVDFETVWHRMLEVTGAKSDADLGAFLGIGRAAVGKQRRDKKIPSGWLGTIYEKTGVTREYLYRDNDLQSRDEGDDFDAKADKALAEVKAWWRAKHGDSDKSALHFAMEVGRRFPELSAPDQDEENREIIKNAEDCRVEALNPEGAGE